MALEDIRAAMLALVQDDAGKISSTEQNEFITQALRKFSRDSPQVKAVDISGNGTDTYALPNDWDTLCSRIIAIYYPNTEKTPLKEREYAILLMPSGYSLKFINYAPGVTESFRLVYTLPWTEITLPLNQTHIPAYWAAHLYSLALAQYYAQTSEPTIGADLVSYAEKTTKYRMLASQMAELYESSISKETGAIGEWDLSYAWGWDMLAHPRRWR